METRAVGEITVFATMMISLFGFAKIGEFGVKLENQTFGGTEVAMIVAIVLVTPLVIWKLYLPPPAAKS